MPVGDPATEEKQESLRRFNEATKGSAVPEVPVLVADERGDPPVGVATYLEAIKLDPEAGHGPFEGLVGQPPRVYVEPPADPWAHRSAGMRCRTCMWFVEKGTGDSRGALGRCRRHAPTMNGYPAVFETDFCGDHKIDETKLAP